MASTHLVPSSILSFPTFMTGTFGLVASEISHLEAAAAGAVNTAASPDYDYQFPGKLLTLYDDVC